MFGQSRSQVLKGQLRPLWGGVVQGFSHVLYRWGNFIKQELYMETPGKSLKMDCRTGGAWVAP